MSLSTTNTSGVHFSSLEDLVKFSKSNSSTPPDQWEQFGYKNEDEFKKLTKTLLNTYDRSKEATEIVLKGRITGFQTKEILQMNPDEKQWCLSAIGIQAIASGISSPSEIASIGSATLGWALTKNGQELLKRGILTLDKIRTLFEKDSCALYYVLGIVKPDGSQHSTFVDTLTAGRITDRQAAEILLQHPDGIKSCIEGIRAIESGLFSISEVAQMKCPLSPTLVFSKNGIELIKRGLLTLTRIETLHEKSWGIFDKILGDVKPDGSQHSTFVNAITKGRITDRQAAEILKQDPDGIRNCIKGIQAIELGMYSIARIAQVENPLNSWAFSKNGIELMKRGILTLDGMKTMWDKDRWMIQIILGSVQLDGSQHTTFVDAITKGRITDRQAKEILEKDPDEIKRCIDRIREQEKDTVAISETAPSKIPDETSQSSDSASSYSESSDDD